MKRLNPKQCAKILFEITRAVKGEKEIARAVSAFVQLLVRQHGTRLLPDILKEFQEHADEQSGKYPVQVTTARPLESGLRKKIEEALGAVIQREAVDTSLIGGVVVKAKSVLLDGSMRGQLSRLHQQLTISN